jgi:hypothetical protein
VALTGAVSLLCVVFWVVFCGGFESAAEAEKRRHIFVPDCLGRGWCWMMMESGDVIYVCNCGEFETRRMVGCVSRWIDRQVK